MALFYASFPSFTTKHSDISLIRSLIIIFCVLSIITQCAAEISRPRGVPLSKASFYNPGRDFVCLDGSGTIPFDHVNDDYCDCRDGSDEPGTSACPNGHFFCSNRGHKGMYILSSRINDGICDCCDGTDEYENIISCSNTCSELGKQAREDAERMQQMVTEGYRLRLDHIEQGRKAIEDKKVRLNELEAEKEEAEKNRNDMEALKNEAEIPEKTAKEEHENWWKEEKLKIIAEKERQSGTEAFQNLDQNNDDQVSIDEMQTHLEFDIDSDGTVSPDEAKEYLEDNENINQDFFLEKVWPNIKAVFKKWHPGMYRDTSSDEGRTGGEEPPVVEQPPAEEMPAEGDGNVQPSQDNNHQPKGDEDPPMPDYPEQTKLLIQEADQARKDYEEANQKYNNIKNEYSELNKYLGIDFGANNEYFSMNGQCFEFTDREYTYKFCPFDRTSQRSKNGGSETSLGTWGHWAGPDNDRYSAMKYERGQNCWNGPDRSCEVRMHCGLENKLTGASEPSRCEYQFHFSTPVACPDPATVKVKDIDHDEL